MSLVKLRFINIWLVNKYQYFLPHYLVEQVFLVFKMVVSGKNPSMLHFRFRHSFNTLNAIFNQICKTKSCTILWKNRKISRIINRNGQIFRTYWPKCNLTTFNTASKVCKFPLHASSHSIFNIFHQDSDL